MARAPILSQARLSIIFVRAMSRTFLSSQTFWFLGYNRKVSPWSLTETVRSLSGDEGWGQTEVNMSVMLLLQRSPERTLTDKRSSSTRSVNVDLHSSTESNRNCKCSTHTKLYFVFKQPQVHSTILCGGFLFLKFIF